MGVRTAIRGELRDREWLPLKQCSDGILLKRKGYNNQVWLKDGDFAVAFFAESVELREISRCSDDSRFMPFPAGSTVEVTQE